MSLVLRPKGYAPAYADRADNSERARPELIERIGLARPWAAINLGAALYMLHLLAVYIDGWGPAFSSFEFWRRNAEMPLIITYILLVHRHTNAQTRRAVAAFRPLATMSDTEYRDLAQRMSAAVARYQPAAMLGVLLLGAVLQELWVWEYGFAWSTLTNKLTVVVEYVLVGSILYLPVARNRVFSQLFRQPLKLDIFSPAPLKPIAEWALGISLAIIGGITISVLTIWDVDYLLEPKQLIIYSLALGSAVIVYFAILLSTHRMMARAKEEELATIRKELAVMYNRLKVGQPAPGGSADSNLAAQVTAWLSYERRIMEAPAWPHTNATLQGLFGSILLPILLTLMQLVLRG